MSDPRTVAAVAAACPRNKGDCTYPACACSLPLIVRRGLDAADAWEADPKQRIQTVQKMLRSRSDSLSQIAADLIDWQRSQMATCLSWTDNRSGEQVTLFAPDFRSFQIAVDKRDTLKFLVRMMEG